VFQAGGPFKPSVGLSGAVPARGEPLTVNAMVFEVKYNQLGNPSDFCATMYYSVMGRFPTINRSANRQPDESQATTA
jgi:hypothetical protein